MAPTTSTAIDQANRLEPLPWLPILETGHEAVDREHRQLIEDANAVHAIVSGGGSWSDLLATAREMRERCIRHFATEDEVLTATRFPDRERHLRAHKRILKAIDSIIADLDAAAPPNRFHWELALSLRGLLVDHLLRDDLKYKSHLMYYEAPRG